MNAAMQWWHIIWVTHQAWPPNDERGNWEHLAKMYGDLRLSGIELEVSDPLPLHWQSRPAREGTINIPHAAFSYLADDLQELTKSDRVAGETPVRILSVAPLSVQMLISCPAASLHQRIGRLKSRSSTLLSFRKELGIGGDATWCRGFWWARISDESALETVANYIANIQLTNRG